MSYLPVICYVWTLASIATVAAMNLAKWAVARANRPVSDAS